MSVVRLEVFGVAAALALSQFACQVDQKNIFWNDPNIAQPHAVALKNQAGGVHIKFTRVVNHQDYIILWSPGPQLNPDDVRLLRINADTDENCYDESAPVPAHCDRDLTLEDLDVEAGTDVTFSIAAESPDETRLSELTKEITLPMLPAELPLPGIRDSLASNLAFGLRAGSGLAAGDMDNDGTHEVVVGAMGAGAFDPILCLGKEVDADGTPGAVDADSSGAIQIFEFDDQGARSMQPRLTPTAGQPYFGIGMTIADIDGVPNADGNLNSELVVGDPYSGTAQDGARVLSYEGGGVGMELVAAAYSEPLLGWSFVSAGDLGGGVGHEVLGGLPFYSPGIGNDDNNGQLMALQWDDLLGPPASPLGTIEMFSQVVDQRVGWSSAVGTTNDMTPVRFGAFGAPGVDTHFTTPFGGSTPVVGQVHLRRLSPTGFAGGAPPTLNQPQGLADTLFGISVAVGDFDGNGHSDVAVGEPHEGAAGRVVVYLYTTLESPPAPIVIEPVASPAGADFGYSIAAGDLNGDFFDDLVVGAPQPPVHGTNGTGEVHVFYGGLDAAQGFTPGPILAPQTGTDLLYGFKVGIVGDVNGDDSDEIMIGAPCAGPTANGDAFVEYGAPRSASEIAIGPPLQTDSGGDLPLSPGYDVSLSLFQQDHRCQIDWGDGIVVTHEESGSRPDNTLCSVLHNGNAFHRYSKSGVFDLTVRLENLSYFADHGHELTSVLVTRVCNEADCRN